jgi:quercetin dioxygenase-like cupin family protein
MATTSSSTTASATGRKRIHDPIHRVSYEFERQGDNLWVYTWMEAGAHLPEHFHPRQEERWQTLEGAVRLKLAGRWRELLPEHGPVSVAPNVRHELRNESGQEARLKTEVIPAGRLEEFLVESSRAAQEGLYNERNLPTSLRGAGWLARFALEHREETVMCSPPPAVQRLVLPLAARVLPG